MTKCNYFNNTTCVAFFNTNFHYLSAYEVGGIRYGFPHSTTDLQRRCDLYQKSFYNDLLLKRVSCNQQTSHQNKIKELPTLRKRKTITLSKVIVPVLSAQIWNSELTLARFPSIKFRSSRRLMKILKPLRKNCIGERKTTWRMRKNIVLS